MCLNYFKKLFVRDNLDKIQPCFIKRFILINNIHNYIKTFNNLKLTHHILYHNNLCRLPNISTINYVKNYYNRIQKRLIVIQILRQMDNYMCYYKDYDDVEYIVNLKISTDEIKNIFKLVE